MAYLGKSITTASAEDTGVKAQAAATFDSLVSGLEVNAEAPVEASAQA